MDFGLTFEKLVLIGVIAAFIIGPERLPIVAEKLAGFVKWVGEYVRDTKTKMRDEMGSEIDDVDWRKLDPRQYDPRRIIRDALMDDTPAAPTSTAAGTSTSAAVMTAGASASAAATAVATGPAKPRTTLMRPQFTRETPPPFDPEAT